MSGFMVTPPTFAFFGSATPGAQAGAVDSGDCNDPTSITFPCGQGAGYSCSGSPSDPAVCRIPASIPAGTNSGGSSGGSSGSSGTLGTVLGLSNSVLQDLLAYKTRSQQISAGQYPASYGTLFGNQAGSLGAFNFSALLPWLLIGFVLLLIFRAVK